jgi:hypothetical protein
MKIQTTTQTTYNQKGVNKPKFSTINEQFEVEDKISDNKYDNYTQYINNLAKIHSKMYDISIEEATENIKVIIDNKDEPNGPSEGLFPFGSNLTDEFTNSLLATSEQLSQTDFQMLLLIISDKNHPTLDDRRYYSHSGKFGTSSYNIVPKNDPQYPINEYAKENFESNKTILNMLNGILEALIESQKKFGGDTSVVKNGFKTLIDNFNKEITKSENEKNTMIENITKNNKPNPLIINDNKSQNNINYPSNF